MKNPQSTLLIVCFFFIVQLVHAQIGRVGINTTDPSAVLHVMDSSVVFTGGATLPPMQNNPPVSGNGIRWMWYPDKAALRAGLAEFNCWDKDSIGNYSIGLGRRTNASGLNASAIGYNTRATGSYSGAFNFYTSAAGFGSVAFGEHTVAGGTDAFATGAYSTAMGNFSSAFGYSTDALGAYSLTAGYHSVASGILGVAIGNQTNAAGNNSASFGLVTKAKPYLSFVLGRYNDTTAISTNSWYPLDPLFIIGNGSSSSDRRNAVTVLKKGYVGINTMDPQAYLHVSDSSVLFTGATILGGTPDDPPVSGQGVRMMWYPDKAALRAGYAESTTWLKDSIGLYSIALGRITKAIGDHSFAAGFNTRAFGSNSVALNASTEARGFASLAIGSGTTTTASYAFAGGYASTASHLYSLAFGYSNIASGTAAVALGFNTEATSSYAMAGGYNTSANSSYSFAFGNGATASGVASVAMGQTTEATGAYSLAMGINTNATNSAAAALNNATTASGVGSFASGYQSVAYGSYATAMGYNTDALGSYATALGYTTYASGFASLATGGLTSASGNYSTSIGYETSAKSYASLVIGRFNDTTSLSSSTWNPADPVFIIGNGSGNSLRSNAFTVLKNGNVGINSALPEYGLHIISTDAADGGWVDGIVLQNTSASTGEAAISMGNAGTAGTGANFWHVGLNQDRYFRWCYGTVFLGGDTKMRLDSLGNLWVDGVYSSSDVNLKRDITPIGNALQKISLLNGYHYYWNTPGKDPGLQTGVLAQEVEEVMPELVKTDEDGIKSIKYEGLIPYLIEAMNTLKEENEQLRVELEEIKAMLDD